MYMADARILPIFHLFTLGVCVGGNANFSVALGVTQILAFLDTNMLVYSMQNFAFGVLSNAHPQREKFCVSVEYRLKE